MCAKKEPREVYQPLADLTEELVQYDHLRVRDLPWVGITAFYALLENV
jgi:hypothetical protein